MRFFDTPFGPLQVGGEISCILVSIRLNILIAESPTCEHLSVQVTIAQLPVGHDFLKTLHRKTHRVPAGTRTELWTRLGCYLTVYLTSILPEVRVAKLHVPSKTKCQSW